MVNHESGLFGVSETSSDMRYLFNHEKRDMRAAEAVVPFCYQAKNESTLSPPRLADWTSSSLRAASAKTRPSSARALRGLEISWRRIGSVT
jgi:hypothetical protein